jgi:hypothetical protein
VIGSSRGRMSQKELFPRLAGGPIRRFRIPWRDKHRVIQKVNALAAAQSASFILRVLVGLIAFVCCVFLGLVGASAFSNAFGEPNRSTLRPAGKSAAGESFSGHFGLVHQVRGCLWCFGVSRQFYL